MNQDELKWTALEFEKKAKVAKEKKDLEEVAQYHLKAANIYKEVDDERNYKFNCANYFSNKGRNSFFMKDYLKSVDYSKKAERLFNELKIKDPAFHCAVDWISALFISLNYTDTKSLIESAEAFELFFARYKDFARDELYLNSKVNYYKIKSIIYRNEKKLELAETWAFDSYEISNKLYEDFGDKYESLNLHAKRMYHNLRAKRFKSERKFGEAALNYKISGDIALKINKSFSNVEYSNYYLCLSLLNKKDKELFTENVDQAIKYSKLNKDSLSTNYFKGYKYEILSKFYPEVKKLELLEKAKKYYYQSNNDSYAKNVEYVIFYHMSKKYLNDGDYEKSLNYFDKTIKYSEYTGFPNIISSKDTLINERNLHEFYFHISNGLFLEASKSIEKWLSNEDTEKTRKYVFNEISGFCCEIISKERIEQKEIFKLANYLNFIQEKKLGWNLFDICSLVYSYASLNRHKVINEQVFSNIKLELISKFTTDDAASYVKESLKVENAVEEREWLSQLPTSIAEKFDKSVYYLENSIEGFESGAFMDFYKLIENFLKDIVKFNAKILWGDDFEWKIMEKIKESNPNSKPFEIFAMGDFLKSLKILKDENSKYCKMISEDTLDLINKHVPLRNKLSHDLEIDLSGINILKDTTEIIINLLPACPTLIKIKSSERKPIYSAEILWNQYPRLINLNHEDILDEGIYYADPLLNVVDNNVFPEILIGM